MFRYALAVLFVLALPSSSSAAVPLQVTHAGYLLEPGDQPVTNPSVAMSFSIWDDVGSPDVSHQVWPEAPNSCNANVRNGRSIPGEDTSNTYRPSITPGN